MANTLKFGNGEWYGKKDTILAYNDLNSNYKPLPFNFSRASNATVINKDGLIETVGSGQPRIDYKDDSKGALKLEPQRTNLITYSSDFPNSYWTKGGASIQGDPSTAGSELIVNGDFATDSDWIKGTGWTISGGKANSVNTLGFQLSQPITYTSGKIYKVTYTISNYVSGSIRAYYGGTGVGAERNANGTYTDYIAASGSQTFYIRSTTTFTGSIDNVSVKEVQGFTSPDGTTNAFKLVESSVNEIHSLVRTFSSTSGNSYSFKIYVKYNGRRHFALRESGSTGYYVVFDLLEGTIISSSNATGTIKPMEDGWFEVTHTSVAGVSFNIGYFLLSDSYVSGNVAPYQGDGTSGVYIYGAQLEAGSYATSYIPTQGSAVTRLADSCSQTVPDGVIGQTEGTLYTEINITKLLGATTRSIVRLGSAVDLVDFSFLGTLNNSIRAVIRTSANTRFQAVFEIQSVGVYKLAIGYKSNDSVFYVNGVQINNTINTSFTIPSIEDITYDYSTELNDSVNQTKLYNTRLSNSELQALTS